MLSQYTFTLKTTLGSEYVARSIKLSSRMKSRISKPLRQYRRPNLRLLDTQQTHNVSPSSPHVIQHTQKTHAHYIKLGISITDTDLVRSYCDSNSLSDARLLFDETPEWDLVSATTIIGHFARHDHHKDAIALFSSMLRFNITPNEYTFGTVIGSCTALRALYVGKQFHAIATKMGLHSNVFVGSSLVDLYAKLGGTMEEARGAFEETHEPNVVSYTSLVCGYLKKEKYEDAQLLFWQMPERNVVSWNAMIGGFSQKGLTEEAVNLFIKMYRQGVQPNESTFPSVFSAAANIAALDMGKSFHACAFKTLGGNYNVFVGNSVISFYAKCGSMDDSVLAFNRLRGKNTVSWNAVICGYAQNGKGKEALELYHKMRLVPGIRPNDVTLLCVLLACNHAGLVDQAYSCFNQAKNEYPGPGPGVLRPEHYACMVDLLSRSGRFSEAETFLQQLPFNPGIGFWKALLGGCQIHSNMELGELAAREIHALDPEDVSSYVMLSNASSAAGRWQSVSMIRKEMKEKGMKRIPGCSWIEISGKVHVFVTGDKRHCQLDEICLIMASCLEHMKEIATTSILLQD